MGISKQDGTHRGCRVAGFTGHSQQPWQEEGISLSLSDPWNLKEEEEAWDRILFSNLNLHFFLKWLFLLITVDLLWAYSNL